MGDATSSFVARAPSPALRPLIDRYVGYRMVGFPSGVHRGLPSRHVTFIVSVGEPIDVVAQSDPHQSPDRYDVVVGGLAAGSVLIAHNGNQEGLAVELTPLGCRSLFGVPARALWNTGVRGDQVLGRSAAELCERLRSVQSWSERFTVMDEVLGRLLAPDAQVAPEVGQAWRLLVASAGTASVTAIANEVGWSRRHLSERFGDEFGLSPKLAARVVRFERARRMLQRPEHPAIADVAAACGYYDQPHLNRDFVDLAGCPPGEWLATELPSVQDGDVLEGAPSGA